MATTRDSSYLELTPAEFQALSDAKATALIQLADRLDRRRALYAMTGIVSGTLIIALCIWVFRDLVLHGCYKSAYAVLGTGVLGIIGRLIAARLQ
jgi:predicted membrane protein